MAKKRAKTAAAKAATPAKTTVQSTGIFRTERTAFEPSGDKEADALQFLASWNIRGAESRLADIDKTLHTIVESFHDDTAGDLMPGAELTANRAQDAIRLVEQVRNAIAQQNISIAVAYALDLGWALCQVGVTQFEPVVLKSQKATTDLAKAQQAAKEKVDNCRDYVRNAALIAWTKNPSWSLTYVRELLADKDGEWRMQFPELPKSLRTIEKHTRGMKPPAAKLPVLR